MDNNSINNNQNNQSQYPNLAPPNTFEHEFVMKKLDEHDEDFRGVYEKLDTLESQVNQVDKSRIATTGMIKNSVDLTEKLDGKVEKMSEMLIEMGKTMVSVQSSLTENKADNMEIKTKIDNTHDTFKDAVFKWALTLLGLALTASIIYSVAEFLKNGKLPFIL